MAVLVGKSARKKPTRDEGGTEAKQSRGGNSTFNKKPTPRKKQKGTAAFAKGFRGRGWGDDGPESKKWSKICHGEEMYPGQISEGSNKKGKGD